MVVLYANINLGMCWSQSFWLSLIVFVSITSNVRLNHSTCALPCGWYVEVWVCVIPKLWQSDEMRLLVRLAPWSLYNDDGISYLKITSSINTLVTVSLLVVFKIKASIHLLNKLVTTNTYLLPCVVSGSGPIISHDIMSKGCLVVIVPCTAGCGALRCWQEAHSAIHFWISPLYPGQ